MFSLLQDTLPVVKDTLVAVQDALGAAHEAAPAVDSVRNAMAQFTYLAASVLFILGLKSLTRPDSARRGMQQAAFGMLFAVIGTLLNQGILTYQ